MPLFDFECPQCHTRIEKLQKEENPHPECEKCQQPMPRVWSMTRSGDSESANKASVRFKFNYNED